MTTSADSDELNQLAGAIRDRAQGGAQPPQALHFLVLADFFRYNVEKGGFAQLFYNLQGNYLEDIDQMLSACPAPVAQSFYAQALRECLDHVPAYQEFLAGEFTDPSPVKDSLHQISFAYFERRVDFFDEASAFIDANRGAARTWLGAVG